MQFNVISVPTRYSAPLLGIFSVLMFVGEIVIISGHLMATISEIEFKSDL